MIQNTVQYCIICRYVSYLFSPLMQTGKKRRLKAKNIHKLSPPVEKKKKTAGDSQNHNPGTFEMPQQTVPEGLMVILRWQDRQTVPEFTNLVNTRLSVSVNSCIREVDRKGMRLRKMSRATSFLERSNTQCKSSGKKCPL